MAKLLSVIRLFKWHVVPVQRLAIHMFDSVLIPSKTSIHQGISNNHEKPNQNYYIQLILLDIQWSLHSLAYLWAVDSGQI